MSAITSEPLSGQAAARLTLQPWSGPIQLGFGLPGSKSLTLRDCALVRVTTSHGVGFMDDWTGAASPPAAVAELAVRLADAIEAEGSYTDAQMCVSQLPAV